MIQEVASGSLIDCGARGDTVDQILRVEWLGQYVMKSILRYTLRSSTAFFVTGALWAQSPLPQDDSVSTASKDPAAPRVTLLDANSRTIEWFEQEVDFTTGRMT